MEGEATNSKPAILMTGAAGGLATTLVGLLSEKYRLVGADPRPLPPYSDFPGDFYQVNYTSRKMAEIFRQGRFQAFILLGRLMINRMVRKSERYDINVLGTQNLLDLALKYGVSKVIVFSTYHVYGAHPWNHVNITENDPLRASQIFPELVDAIELDSVSRMFLLQHRQVQTVILRPVNVIGPRIQNQISRFLRLKYCPKLLGYDPMIQLIHESDIARALRLCLDSDRSGVYNVAGEGAIAFKKAIEIAGATPVPVPHFLAYPTVEFVSRFGKAFPKHLIDYFRYSTVVSDQAFRRDFNFSPSVTTVEALRSLRSQAV